MDRYSVFLGMWEDARTATARRTTGRIRPRSSSNRVASIEGIGGVDLVVNAGFLNRESEIGGHLARTGLTAVSLNPDLFSDPEFRQGSYSSVSASTRKKALDLSLRSVDAARAYGCPLVVLWTGQDGYDYIFSSPITSRSESASPRPSARSAATPPEITIGLEYKPKEPRTRSYLAPRPLRFLSSRGRRKKLRRHARLRGTRSTRTKTRPSRWRCSAAHGNRPRALHMNDNYRSWDDDMMWARCTTLEYLEFFYWLGAHGYDGWLTIDQFPYREDGRDAVAESVRWMQKLRARLYRTDMSAIERVLASKDAVASSRLMRSILFP